MLGASTVIFLARAMALLWDTQEHTQAISIQPRKPIQPSTPRRSRRTPTATERVSRLAKRSVKQLGGQSASQTLKPATRHGQRSTLWEMALLSGARQQMLQEAGGPAHVDCSACRAGWGAA